MPPRITLFLAGAIVLLGILFQVYLAPLIELGGLFRKVEPLNTEHCESVEGIARLT